MFETLNAVNVNDHTEKKGRLTYLSWTWAWACVKERYPDANYTVYERPDGVNYFTDGKTCWVKVGVTINGLEHIEHLPVMDNLNKSIQLDVVTSRNVNDSIKRCLTKACAMHGLGLYIYSGEDLPSGADDRTADKPEDKPEGPICEMCGRPVTQKRKNDGSIKTPEEIAEWTKSQHGRAVCWDCHKKLKAQADARMAQDAAAQLAAHEDGGDRA